MPALIPQLITMASNPEVKTTDLLRNALVAARKLKQPDWVSWIKNELDGYPKSAVIPQYRILTGQLYAINPGKGLVLLPVLNAELHEVMTTCPFYYPIDGVEPLASGTEYVVLPMDPSQSKMVAALYKMPIAPQVRFGANQVQRLIGAVRTKVLEWALDLDELGIQGEGMSFTTQEQKQAESVTNIFIGGDVIGGQMMLGSPGGQQQQTVTGEQKTEALAALLPWLQQVIAQGQLQGEACAELQAELDTLKAQAASPNPKWSVIGAVVGSVRTILESAGGGILVAQAQRWMATLRGG